MQKQPTSLKAWRKAEGLNQTDAARIFAVSQAQWGRIERSEAAPRKALARRILKGTGVPLDVLMGIAV